MIKKLIEQGKAWLKRKEQLKKSLKYYNVIKAGNLFCQFIFKDLENYQNNNMNRQTRRRFQQYMNETGKLNKEIVDHYAPKIDEIIKSIETEMKKK